MFATTKRYPTATQDQMNFITRSKANQQLNVIIVFTGHLDEQRLRRALRLVMDRDPVLGCRFVEQPNRTYWERRPDLDQLELCQVVATEDLALPLMAFCTAPTDPRQDPLLRACIFREAENDTLCLKVDHVAADGTGAKEAAYLVADTYTRLENDPAYSLAPGRFNPRGQAAFFKQAGLKKLIQYRPRASSMPTPQFSLPFLDPENHGQTFAIRRVEPQAFRALKAFGKQHKATINDLVLTAFFRALMAQANPPSNTRLSLQLPIDLRQFLPEGHPQRVCNLSSALFPSVTYQPGETFLQTLEQVRATIAHWKSREPGLTGAMLMELAMLQGFAKAKQMIGGITTSAGNQVNPLLFSNLGMLDEKRLVFGSRVIRQAYELGPVMLGHGLMLTASTYRERMTLAMGYCRSNLPENTVEALIEQVWEELINAIPQEPVIISRVAEELPVA